MRRVQAVDIGEGSDNDKRGRRTITTVVGDEGKKGAGKDLGSHTGIGRSRLEHGGAGRDRASFGEQGEGTEEEGAGGWGLPMGLLLIGERGREI